MMNRDYKTPVGAAPPDWRGLCEELTEHLALLDEPPHELVCRAQAALAQPEPEVVEPTDEEIADAFAEGCRDGSKAGEPPFLRGARAVLARWGRQPAPPAEGEVDGAMLPRVGHILRLAEIIREVDGNHDKGAAALAEAILSHTGIRSAGLAAPPPAEGEVAELVAWLRMQGKAQKPGPNSLLSDRTKKEHHAAGVKLTRAADLLERQAAPVPVAVSERLPGPEDCDAEGRVWGTAELGGWRLVHHSKIGLWREWLPARALPLPGGEVEHD